VFTGRTRAQVLHRGVRPDLPAQRIRHLLTAQYSPTTTGKIERLHKTMRKELFDGLRIASIELAQAELDAWAVHYNHEREHQAIGDMAPIRRFELFERTRAVVVDPDGSGEDETAPDVESAEGLLNVTHNGVLVATHARRHMRRTTIGWIPGPRSHEQLDPPPEKRSRARWTLQARSASPERPTGWQPLTLAPAPVWRQPLTGTRPH
jgi:hypothetical protein